MITIRRASGWSDRIKRRVGRISMIEMMPVTPSLGGGVGMARVSVNPNTTGIPGNIRSLPPISKLIAGREMATMRSIDLFAYRCRR
jgi:hypothetical protein